ncbi:MAG: Isoaspartyl aminopeptidase [Gemmatimonadetes bacterium]|nr:Isoaspartyl aminopeptidase [Gemmatimonadota bacterium]
MTILPRSVRLLPARGAVLAAFLACASLPAAAQAGGRTPTRAQAPAAPRWGMVIHGGAGTLTRDAMTPEREAAYRAGLAQALQAGYAVLERGGSSLDAVQAAINVMEDSPLFNAGRGAVFTHEGKNELDAAIMDGRTMGAGAVAGVHHIKNPINLAREVMEHSPHVLLTGQGAEEFALERGMPLVPESYFYVESRWQGLQRAIDDERRKAAAGDTTHDPHAMYSVPDERKFGTVGAVALDRAGNLAAGTSTGGTTNKRWGRVGDAPIIGAGTYASNGSCGVSATGTGEYFIRWTVAHDICALVQYRGMTVQAAADEVVMHKLVQAGGDGGIITMDPQGNWALVFNTTGMYRGHVGADGRVEVAIFKDQPLAPASTATAPR